MKKLIHMDDSHLGNLICDNPRCDHVDADQKFGAWLIGKLCPKCGENLLTQRDFNSVMKMKRWVDWANKWFGWLGTENKNDPRLKVASYHVHNDKVTLKINE